MKVSENKRFFFSNIVLTWMSKLLFHFKPIFHCDAKYLASGYGIGPEFCVGVTNMLVYFGVT